MERYLYSELAKLIQARKNCEKSGNKEWFDKHESRIESLVDVYLPSGSGFDGGTRIDMDSSHADCIIFYTDFHHMDDNGYYDGWTSHKVTIKPSLAHGFHVRISGRDRNQINDYIADKFNSALNTAIALAESGEYEKVEN